jgi:hypothetical protein
MSTVRTVENHVAVSRSSPWWVGQVQRPAAGQSVVGSRSTSSLPPEGQH